MNLYPRFKVCAFSKTSLSLSSPKVGREFKVIMISSFRDDEDNEWSDAEVSSDSGITIDFPYFMKIIDDINEKSHVVHII